MNDNDFRIAETQLSLKEKIPVFKFALREDLKDDKQFIPTRAEPLATGWDCRAAQLDRKDLVVRPGEYVKLPLGFRAFCPPGYWYELHPRSSSFVKKYMHCLTGVIDETFPGQLILAFTYIPNVSKSEDNNLIIKFGDPIAQIIPIKRQEMETGEISNEEYEKMLIERNAVRTGGIGSTHK